ncbi:zinc ribbon domain-containing protein [Okeania sp. SIO2B3]|uniref:zinc ribbon domain-containing protein n=1 Tax=Okeania sp. SIO2B3 TaxID=2607784 RepID=UPI0025F2FB6C|nr:zinc ribbon domain-containing protein [Okeania sp. SIO2B3]
MVDRFFPSSKTCSNCGHVQDMPLNVRTYDCPECGLSILLRFKRQYKEREMRSVCSATLTRFAPALRYASFAKQKQTTVNACG